MRFGQGAEHPELFQLCFVCTGNICRSPMAEIVFRDTVAREGYGALIDATSAGTGDWHVGEAADSRTIDALAARGYDGSNHRARQFDPDWFAALDLVVSFDRTQERILREWAPTEADRVKVQPLLGFDPDHADTDDVPDPYYSDAQQFDRVLVMIEHACGSLFRQIKPGVRAGTTGKPGTAGTPGAQGAAP